MPNVPLCSSDLHTVRHRQAPVDKEKQTQGRNESFHHFDCQGKQLQVQQKLKNVLNLSKNKNKTCSSVSSLSKGLYCRFSCSWNYVRLQLWVLQETKCKLGSPSKQSSFRVWHVQTSESEAVTGSGPRAQRCCIDEKTLASQTLVQYTPCNHRDVLCHSSFIQRLHFYILFLIWTDTPTLPVVIEMYHKKHQQIKINY